MYFWEMLRTRDRRTFWVREPNDYATLDSAMEMAPYLNRCNSRLCKGHRLIKVETVNHGNLNVPIYYTLHSKLSVRA